MQNRKMKNKNKLIIGASVASALVIAGGTFAFFADSVEETLNSKVGNVSIEIEECKITHSDNLNNINPGDNDPTLVVEEEPSGDSPGSGIIGGPSIRPGSDHELSFVVNNTGNKSVITRTVITVSGTSTGATPIGTDDLANIILSEKATYSANASANDSDKSTTVTKLTPYGTDGNALVYVIGGTRDEDVLNGFGENAEIETVSSSTTLSKTFDIGLDKEVTADSPLMGADLTFKVEVQAMQYRNTGDQEWNTIFEETYNTSTNM